MIGAGKNNTNCNKLIPSVLTSSFGKSLLLKNLVKLEKPTHGLPHIPLKGL
jgi:hypothetical protein